MRWHSSSNAPVQISSADVAAGISNGGEAICGSPSSPVIFLLFILLHFTTVVLGPQAKLAEGTSAHRLSSLLGARFLLDQRHVTLKGEDLSMQPFDRYLLDQRVLVVDLEEFLGRIDHERYVVSGQSLLDVIGLLIDLDAAVRTNATSKGLAMNALQPAVRIDLIWYREQGAATLEKPHVEAGPCTIGAFSGLR
jgi:hypothetical protein